MFYGHIHQEHHHKTGNIEHHAAKGLMFAQPAPGSQPKRTPVMWDPAQPYKGLGFRGVQEQPKSRRTTSPNGRCRKQRAAPSARDRQRASSAAAVCDDRVDGRQRGWLARHRQDGEQVIRLRYGISRSAEEIRLRRARRARVANDSVLMGFSSPGPWRAPIFRRKVTPADPVKTGSFRFLRHLCGSGPGHSGTIVVE